MSRAQLEGQGGPHAAPSTSAAEAPALPADVQSTSELSHDNSVQDSLSSALPGKHKVQSRPESSRKMFDWTNVRARESFFAAVLDVKLHIREYGKQGDKIDEVLERMRAQLTGELDPPVPARQTVVAKLKELLKQYADVQNTESQTGIRHCYWESERLREDAATILNERDEHEQAEKAQIQRVQTKQQRNRQQSKAILRSSLSGIELDNAAYFKKVEAQRARSRGRHSRPGADADSALDSAHGTSAGAPAQCASPAERCAFRAVREDSTTSDSPHSLEESAAVTPQQRRPSSVASSTSASSRRSRRLDVALSRPRRDFHQQQMTVLRDYMSAQSDFQRMHMAQLEAQSQALLQMGMGLQNLSATLARALGHQLNRGLGASGAGATGEAGGETQASSRAKPDA